MQILQGISAGENLRGDDTAEHLDGADSAEISTADDVFVTVDLFASRSNTQLPRFISWKPDPQALATNALQVPWIQETGFACPPWALISQCLMKIQREQSTLTLVTPYWPSAIWFESCRWVLKGWCFHRAKRFFGDRIACRELV